MYEMIVDIVDTVFAFLKFRCKTVFSANASEEKPKRSSKYLFGYDH